MTDVPGDVNDSFIGHVMDDSHIYLLEEVAGRYEISEKVE